MNENCAACRADYEVTPQNGGLVLYLNYAPANHLLSTCPHCGTQEVIYMRAPVIMDLLTKGSFPLVVGDTPTEDRRTAADACWTRSAAGQAAGPGSPDTLPGVPREWLRQLHDDLRDFGRAG